LRDRKEDISALASYFVDRYAKRAGRKIRGVRKSALDSLQSYSWPGNIRELHSLGKRKRKLQLLLLVFRARGKSRNPRRWKQIPPPVGNFFTAASCPPFFAYLIFVYPNLLADRDQFW
jgi:hypothetical protein